jgi:hypothetical protein
MLMQISMVFLARAVENYQWQCRINFLVQVHPPSATCHEVARERKTGAGFETKPVIARLGCGGQAYTAD